MKKIPPIKELKRQCGPWKEDTFYGWFILRKISIYITWLFLHAGITPNQVTILSGIVGILGSLLFFFEEPVYWVLAWFALQLYLLLDHVDGEIARYQKNETKFGEYLDTLMHPVINSFIFIPITFGLYNIFNTVFIFPFGFSIVCCMLLFSIHRTYVTYIMGGKPIEKFEHDQGPVKKTMMFFTGIGGVIHTTLIPSLLDLLLSFLRMDLFINFRLLFLVVSGVIFPIIFIRRLFNFWKKMSGI